ncbi:MAG: FeoB-associated Cys-rich membrane protein [Cellulosilyticaceae bacterium]
MANIIIGSIVIGLLILATIKVIKDKKKSGCSCGCSGCSSSASCHSKLK